MDIKQKIIQRFNAQLGSDIKNLRGIYDFHENLKAEKNEIEKSVSCTVQKYNMKNLYSCLLFYSYQWHQAPLLPK